MRTIWGIQYLRGLAALLVLVHHVGKNLHFDFNVGAAGVDIFFLISGFIMWVTTYGRTVTFKQFMSRRLKRIIPLYWIVTLATLTVAMIKPQFFFGLDAEPLKIAQSILFIPYYRESGLAWPIVGQGWTLNIEMFFYLVFALSVAMVSTLRLIVPTVILCSLVVLGWIVPHSDALTHTWTNPIIIELVSGLWLGWAYTEKYLKRYNIGIVMLCLSLIGFVSIQTSNYAPEQGWRLVFLGIPSLLLTVGILMIESQRPLPKILIPAFVGDASYSIYLWHSLAIMVFMALGLRVGFNGTGAIEALLVGSLSLACALIGFICVERPLSKLEFAHIIKNASKRFMRLYG